MSEALLGARLKNDTIRSRIREIRGNVSDKTMETEACSEIEDSNEQVDFGQTNSDFEINIDCLDMRFMLKQAKVLVRKSKANKLIETGYISGVKKGSW